MNPMPGIQLRETSDGTAILYVHAHADPDKRSVEWRDKARSLFSNEAIFRQEIDIDFNALSGANMFPEFDEAIHVVQPSQIPKTLCCYCSIDPHPRTPTAALWLGVDTWSDLWIYRELWPSKAYGEKMTLRDSDQDTNYKFWEYAETIAWLEGNEIDWHNRGTADEYGIYKRSNDGERVIDRFMDQAGKGFSVVQDEDSRVSIAETFAKCGIDCTDPYKRHEAGYDAIHRVLQLRNDSRHGKWPRLHISSECRELILEIKNLRYKERKSLLGEEELWQRAVKARRHQVDNLRYLLTSEPAWIPALASRRHEFAKSEMAA